MITAEVLSYEEIINIELGRGNINSIVFNSDYKVKSVFFNDGGDIIIGMPFGKRIFLENDCDSEIYDYLEKSDSEYPWNFKKYWLKNIKEEYTITIKGKEIALSYDEYEELKSQLSD